MESVKLTPTVVIGLGQAGCRMAAAVNELGIKESVEESIKILGIDSDSESLARALPADSDYLSLNFDDISWKEAQNQAPYLEPEHELPDIGGAARQRPVGRRYVDNAGSLERTWKFFEHNIEEFISELDASVDNSSDTEINVWIVNSLAGGTGSGTFPLITGLLNKLLMELETERSIQTTLCGVGSLLRLDRLTDQLWKPDNPSVYYINAYTALSDLQTLLSDEQASVSIYGDSSRFIQDTLDVGGVLDQYLLAGVHNQQRDHLTSVNEMIADAIYYFGLTTAIENFPDSPEVQSTRLLSLDAGELRFPANTADQYLQVGDDIAERRQKLDELEYDREDLAEDLTYIEAVLSLDRDSLPSTDSPVPRKLVRWCEDEATSVARRAPEGELYNHIDDTVAALRNDFEPDDDYGFNFSVILRYLFLTRLMTKIEQERNRVRDELSSLVTTALRIYADQLAEYFDEGTITALESNPALEATQLEQFLKDERERLDEQRDESLPFIANFFDDLGARISEIDHILTEVETLNSEYDKYQALSEQSNNALSESRETLLELRRDIEDNRYELDDSLAKIARELETLNGRKERIVSELRNPSGDRHQTTIAIEHPDRLDSTLLDQAREEGFTALVEADIVDQKTLQLATKQVCSNRHEPIQDRPGFLPPFSVLAPVLAEENIEDWLDDIESAARATGFDMVEDPVDTSETLSIGFLGFYAGIQLDGTSEFGTLAEYITDPGCDLSDLFGPDIESVPDPVAYPELQ